MFVNKVLQSFGLFVYRWSDYKGRSTQQEYWYPLLTLNVLYLGLNFLSSKLAMACVIISMPALVTLSMRRMHDTGFSALWLLSPLIFGLLGFLIYLMYFQLFSTPDALEASFSTVGAGLIFLMLMSQIFLLFLLARNSTPGDNAFGAPSDYMQRQIDWNK